MHTIDVMARRPARIRRNATLSTLACACLLAFGTMLHAEGRSVTHKVPPAFPAIAMTLHLGGVVKVRATVNPAGDVIEAKAEGGNKLFAQPAEDAVKKWKFEPGSAQTIEQVEVVFDAN